MEIFPGKVRIDKWLWAVRLFKSRSIASEACDKGKVKIGDQPVKPSRNIRVGEVITIRRRAFTMQFKILQLTENRQPVKSVSDFCKDITPEEDVEKMKIHSIETPLTATVVREDQLKKTEGNWMSLFPKHHSD